MSVKQKCYLFVSIGLLSLCLTSCASVSKLINPGGDLLGSWKLKDSNTTISFRSDNTFQVDVLNDKTADIWGTYQLFDNRIEFDDTHADKISDCLAPGFYLYSVSGKNLNFEVFADECFPRKKILNKTWQSIPTIPEEALHKAESPAAK